MSKIIKKFRCEHCEYKTNIVTNFNKHSRIHNTNKEYKCDRCNASFDFVYNLNRHRGQIHNKSKRECTGFYTCSKCGLVASSYGSLTEHMNRFHEEKCICNRCGINFDNDILLQRHLLDHSKL